MQTILNVLLVIYLISKEWNNVKTFVIRAVDKFKFKLVKINEELSFNRMVNYIISSKADNTNYVDIEEEMSDFDKACYNVCSADYILESDIELEVAIEQYNATEYLPVTDVQILEAAITANIGNIELYKLMLDIQLQNTKLKETA